MLPAIGLAAEALTTFICGLYIGFRSAHRPYTRPLAVFPDVITVFGLAAVSLLSDSSSGSAVASGMVAVGVFAFVFGGRPFRLVLSCVLAMSFGLLVATSTGDQPLGLLLWETALVVPATIFLLFPTAAPDRTRGPGWIRSLGTLSAITTVVLFVELFFYRRGIRQTSIGVSTVALLAAILFLASRMPFQPDRGSVSEVLATGVVHEYRKLLGRLQLLIDFGTRYDGGFEVAEGHPDPLRLISQEIRLSAASLPGLDALYGQHPGGRETRVPGDVDAILRLAGPLFRRAGKSLELRVETGMVIAASPDIVLHCLLILLRNAADYAASGSDPVTLSWRSVHPDGEALLRIVNGAELANGRPPRVRGWGRGLAIARGLSRRSGGDLTIRRTRGSFSVELRFPLSKPS
jgi:hypothetical protein